MRATLTVFRILAVVVLLRGLQSWQPAFAGPVMAPREVNDADLDLARRMVTLLRDNSSGKCVSCHAAGYEKILIWGKRLQQLDQDCLGSNLHLTARQRVACLRDRAGDEQSGFSPENLGMLAAGTGSASLRALFTEAYPDPIDFQKNYGDFTGRGSMPIAGAGAPALTEQEFTDMRHWIVERSMARLQDVLPNDSDESCTVSISDELQAAVAQSQKDGWQQRHLENGLPMLGCEPGQDARDCLQNYTDITTGTGFANVTQNIRKLYETNDSSHYWVRSSPDGRYFARGSDKSKIVDLTLRTGRAQQEFTIKAPYDPEFLADNSGFSYAETNAGGIRICKSTLLARLAPLATPTVTFNEPECKRVGDGTYQSFGVSLTGSSYTLTMGSYNSDTGNGPDGIETNANATVNFSVLKYNGVDYVPKGKSTLALPFESEPIIAPSGGMLVTRYGKDGQMKGYRLHILSTETNRDPVVVHERPVGTVCGVGGKATFSLNERFIAYHRYYDTEDPSSTHMKPGSANIFVVDLLTGKTTQITDMPANTRALFPHFRADGWMYFLVKDNANRKEYLAASNAVLSLQ